MDYISTRGKIAPVGFIDAVLMGLADDGGLIVPSHLPQLSEATLRAWQQLSYPELALELFSLFVDGEIPREELKQLVDESYGTFRDDEVTPVRRVNNSLHILELFHGPTFAFKDIALQFLGNLYGYISKKRNSTIHILGATSGDTGASAIEGVRGKEGIRICILHPHGKVSKVQELQMTTVDDANVLNLAVDGNFDDCQRIIKELFADVSFKQQYHLRAINSINIARILAQTVYYFYAYFQLAKQGQGEKVNFSVPTGNFGDIFAGYLAKRMGLPIHKLILATNENNILEHFVTAGVYQPGEFRGTHSPSMDIQVASNFERYLYYLNGEDAGAISGLMDGFKRDGQIVVNGAVLEQVQADFAAYAVKNDECLSEISSCYNEYGYLLDPHTACGVAAAHRFTAEDEVTVALSTAHPAKFDEAIRLIDIKQTTPVEIQALSDKPQFQTRVVGTNEAVSEQLVRFF
ncbi:threonine synthase [Paenibacillus sacheonensis]|uniref:Threonine synthase n=1 Tax=Paenibacillus sacheonensis TaxID=742054 RepID=A0A7X4YU53_9BACL|nr:threonine synthase [Paenibacillus sacheonensis]MBM7566967.1 threonine synthase [Paenibacillus sacheonensis]NBC71589.1 threonine synthase [Paenibacillus sacheonensis]